MAKNTRTDGTEYFVVDQYSAEHFQILIERVKHAVARTLGVQHILLNCMQANQWN